MFSVLHSSTIVRALLHGVLIILVTIHCIDWNVNNAVYVRSMRRTFTQLFGIDTVTTANPALGFSSKGAHMELFTFNETFDALQRLRDNYYLLANRSTANLQYASSKTSDVFCSSTPSQPILLATYHWDSHMRLRKYVQEVNLTTNLALLSSAGPRAYFAELYKLENTMYLCSVDEQTKSSMGNKYNKWKVQVTYSFQNQMYLDVQVVSSLLESRRQLDTNAFTVNQLFVWIDILTLLFGSVYLVFVLKVRCVCLCVLGCCCY
jgi:hypothetical protein